MGPILLFGTGRLAFHLGHALRRAGIPLAGVVGRRPEAAAGLANELGTEALAPGAALPAAALRVLAVSDDAIGSVAAAVPPDGTPIVHLGGSRPLDLLEPHAHRAVLWPMQSFTPGPPVDFSTVPVVIDANDEAALALVRALAGSISGHVVHLPFDQRQRLHLSAVLASNFPVFLLREAERLLGKHGIDPGLLHPLWKQSAQNALRDADRAVTGPARRGDAGTLAKHLELLNEEGELRRAYAILSNLIYFTYHPGSRGNQDL